MELQFYGANCVRLVGKKAVVTVDDNLADLGLSSATKAGDIVLFTGIHGIPDKDVKMLINQPGEYDVSNISIQGIAARSHLDEDKKLSATIFKVVADDTRVVFLGHIYPELSEAQLESIGKVDILVIPVGGNGYTLDPVGALKLIKKIEPKIVVPTHYGDAAINYPVPQQELEEALKVLALDAAETVPKLKIKSGEIAEGMRVVLLERQ